MRLPLTCAAALLTGVALTLSACGDDDSQLSKEDQAVASTLRVGVIPNIAPEEQKAKYQPVGDYLAKALDRKIELFAASDYAGVVAALASERIDVAYLGGLTYVQAEQQVELTPLVTEIDALTKTKQYESAIVVKKDSTLASAKDVVAAKGTFAFGDPASTSGSLYPRIMLTEAGVTCDTVDLTKCPPLKSVTFTGGHDATAEAVASGSIDAGGLELRILRKLEKEETIEAGALKVIETKLVPGYPWVGRTALGDETLEKIQQAFLDIKDPKLLDLLRAESYDKIEASEYDEIREQAKTLGLLTPAKP